MIKATFCMLNVKFMHCIVYTNTTVNLGSQKGIEKLRGLAGGGSSAKKTLIVTSEPQKWGILVKTLNYLVNKEN